MVTIIKVTILYTYLFRRCAGTWRPPKMFDFRTSPQRSHCRLVPVFRIILATFGNGVAAIDFQKSAKWFQKGRLASVRRAEWDTSGSPAIISRARDTCDVISAACVGGPSATHTLVYSNRRTHTVYILAIRKLEVIGLSNFWLLEEAYFNPLLPHTSLDLANSRPRKSYTGFPCSME